MHPHDASDHLLSTSLALDTTIRDVRLHIESSSFVSHHLPHPSGRMSVRPPDVSSLASSTHFTLVNGFGKMRQPEPAKRRRCAPLTALVLTMTLLLALIVSSLVIFTECKPTNLSAGVRQRRFHIVNAVSTFRSAHGGHSSIAARPVRVCHDVPPSL